MTIDVALGDETLLTVPEACARLRISRWMLYRLIQANQLRTITVGRRRLVPRSAISDFVSARIQNGASR